MNRRNFLRRAAADAAGLVAAGAVCSPELACSKAPSTRGKPNIIYIMADDLGYGDLGCYGQELIRTPAIDRMAAEGTRFTDCYAGSTVCGPSRCCLLTGKHTGHARIRGNKLVPLRAEDLTVSEAVKQAGYTTGAIGKWGQAEPGTSGVPNLKGFDYWIGYLNRGDAHNYHPDFLWKNQEKYPLNGSVYSHDLFTEEALKFIRSNQDNPFFLYLAYTIPHANNELGWETGNGMEVPGDEPYSNEDWPQMEKNFAAMVARMDRDVGRLLSLLEELGLDENTVVFFTSDNGPHSEGGTGLGFFEDGTNVEDNHNPWFFKSSGPFRGIKRDLYEGGIRVPMIVRWPGKVPAGRTSGQVWAFWDFLPTAAEIAGAAIPDNLDGISMLPALLGKPQRDHEHLYWEFYERGFQQALRMGRWKALRLGPEQPLELYDLGSDPGETVNLAAGHPELLKKIEGILETCHGESEVSWFRD
ncbi:MAG: arylsulfatase [Candidatus Glassbacteria bacterium]|nr:arylsulfatase [Candidatus Glassbacteria bacterium]